MKSNAIVRIVIWSVVILVLLAVLIAGLANNLFTMFHGSTDTVYHSTDVANSEPPAGQSDTPIAERSVSVVSQTSVYTMPNTQSASVGALNVGDNVVIDRSEEVGGGSWIHITSPVDGWVNAECLKLNGVNQTGSVGSADPAAIREIKIEWISGSFGSHVSYLYPMSILKGKGAKMEFTGITFAGKGQNLDTGAKVVHSAPDTSSYINTRSISKDGGISTFRSSVVVAKEAENAKAAVSCQSLMLDSISRSDTIPAMDIRTRKANVGHEAQIGSISDDAVFYLMSRGMSEEDARACIVSGFADNVSKELPLEYALEMNNLIRLEMKGSIG